MLPTNDVKVLPRLLITMGDVAGIGPEIIARAWPDLTTLCRPVVVGDPAWLTRAIRLVESPAVVRTVLRPDELDATRDVVPCLPASRQDLSGVQTGKVSAAAGQAAYDFLCAAIDWTRAGVADGIVTAPLHKEGLRAAGLLYPGHTEILAERTGTKEFAMLLSVPGLIVAHVTLHMALRDVFRHLTTGAVLEKIRLLVGVTRRLEDRDHPRIGVSALNPHAGDGGLFGDEEVSIIRPAVEAARAEGIDATGPWPSDTLFSRARKGEFGGVVAMYHDQGHIALKLLGGMKAVNISAGLPIVRTSVAHGTAYDIAGRGIADATSLIEATRVAARLATHGTER
jgi:4-hydroxythreonine-4-phosphate dehydrogenase